MTSVDPVPASPYQTPLDVGKPEASLALVDSPFEPLYRRRIWIRLLGICSVISGIVFSLTVIGALFGLPLIVAGVFFYQAAGCYEEGYRLGDAVQLYHGSSKLSIAVLLSLVSLGLVTLLMLAYFGFIFAMYFVMRLN